MPVGLGNYTTLAPETPILALWNRALCQWLFGLLQRFSVRRTRAASEPDVRGQALDFISYLGRKTKSPATPVCSHLIHVILQGLWLRPQAHDFLDDAWINSRQRCGPHRQWHGLQPGEHRRTIDRDAVGILGRERPYVGAVGPAPARPFGYGVGL